MPLGFVTFAWHSPRVHVSGIVRAPRLLPAGAVGNTHEFSLKCAVAKAPQCIHNPLVALPPASMASCHRCCSCTRTAPTLHLAGMCLAISACILLKYMSFTVLS